MYNWWKGSRPDIIVRELDHKDIEKIFQHGRNTIPIGPTQFAVVIKEGKMLATLSQEKIKIGSTKYERESNTTQWRKDGVWSEQFGTQMTRLIGERDPPEPSDQINYIKERVRDGYLHIVMADATTIDVEMPVSESHNVYSKDHKEKFTGYFKIRFEFDSQNIPKVLGLMGEQKSLTKGALMSRLEDEIIPLLQESTKKYDPDEIIGNKNLREQIEMTIRMELRKTFENWGISVQNVMSNWNESDTIQKKSKMAALDRTTEFEKEKFLKQRELEKTKGVEAFKRTFGRKRAQQSLEKMDRDYERDVERGDRDFEYEKEGKELDYEQAIEGQKTDFVLSEERKKTAHEIELEQMKDKLANERREKELEFDRKIEAEKLSIEREKMAVAGDRLKMLQLARKERALLKIEKEKERHLMKMDQKIADYEHQIQTEQMRLDHTESMRDKESDHLLRAQDKSTDMQQQMARQAIASGNVEMVKAIQEISAQQTRQQQIASGTYGDTESARIYAQSEAERMKAMMTSQTQASSAPVAQTSPSGIPCPHCQATVQPGWKACPACGNQLGPPKCPSCEAEVQAGWKACPECGNRLG